MKVALIQMHKIFFLIVLLASFLFSMENLTANKTYKLSSNAQDIKVIGERLFVGTSGGKVEIFDINSTKKLQTIELEKIKDFMGDLIGAKIYSIDILNEKILIVSQGKQGYRNIFLYHNEKLEKVLGTKAQYLLQEAVFVNEEKIIFATLGNQIALFDINKKKLDYKTQISYSSFSDFQINEDKTKLATTDESGVVNIFDIKNGKVIKKFKGINLDRVYQLDYKKDIVLTAGQDRKAVVFKKFSTYSLDFDFLLYSCAISKNAKYGAIAYNEENEVLIFDINSKVKLYSLEAQKGTLSKILFKGDDEVFLASESDEINYFNFKEK